MDSNDFLEDYTTEEFKQKAAEALKSQSDMNNAKMQLEQQTAQANLGLAQANVAYTEAQAKNTMDDNARQMAVAIDKHFQEWADLSIKAAKEGTQPPQAPDFQQIVSMAAAIMAGQKPQQ